MQIKVKFVNAPKEGKKYGSIVGADDARFPCPAALISQFQKGGTYEVKTEDQTWGDKEVTVITAVKSGGGGTQPTAPNGDKWWLPFVSNTVAHAIAAGRIESPIDIKGWAAAAKQAAEEIASGKQLKTFDDIDEDIPL